MTDARKILEMIKSADPSDRKTLDEIDARIWCYLKDLPFIDMEPRDHRTLKSFSYRDCGGNCIKGGAPDYTRSRDIIKSMRPEGWYLTHIGSPMHSPEKHSAVLAKTESDIPYIQLGPYLPTEELAELHAIIQAIEYERNASKGGV